MNFHLASFMLVQESLCLAETATVVVVGLLTAIAINVHQPNCSPALTCKSLRSVTIPRLWHLRG
jgi:hypothetical protein